MVNFIGFVVCLIGLVLIGLGIWGLIAINKKKKKVLTEYEEKYKDSDLNMIDNPDLNKELKTLKHQKNASIASVIIGIIVSWIGMSMGSDGLE